MKVISNIKGEPYSDDLVLNEAELQIFLGELDRRDNENESGANSK
jgi:hypothetical protein